VSACDHVRYQRRITTQSVQNAAARLVYSQVLVGATTSHRCCSSSTGCQTDNNGSCSRSQDSSTSHLLKWPPCTSLMATACCRMPAVACCSRISVNCGICSYRAHTANWMTQTTYHQDYNDRDCHLTLSNNLFKLTCLASESHSDSIEFICAMQQELIRRWDSERQLFYDEFAHRHTYFEIP